VNAALDGLSSKDEGRRHSAQHLFEEWLKLAIDTDLRRYAAASHAGHHQARQLD
jgi:hypothetical protein